MKSQEFLAKKKVTVDSQTNAKKQVFGETEARDMLKGIERLISIKGPKVVSVNLRKEKPDWSELRVLLLGPTGNLRAPVIRKGKTLIIGFNRDLYLDQLG